MKILSFYSSVDTGKKHDNPTRFYMDTPVQQPIWVLTNTGLYEF